MTFTSMCKLRWAIFQGAAAAWLRNIFSTSQARAERYRQAVVEETFETWMDSGEAFARVISERIEIAGRRGDHNAVRFWQDVLVSVHDFESDPENRRNRDAITFRCDEEAAA